MLSHLVKERPVKLSARASGTLFIDFGRVAFGNLRLLFPSSVSDEMVVHFGEALAGDSIDRHPPGSVRYQCVKVAPARGGWQTIAPLADERNTGAQAVILPPEWGVILPFRWVEIEGWPDSSLLDSTSIERRVAYSRTWDDSASGFASSDEMLDRIWELCRYSIKAMTFAGVYVDGDRERIPYEADSYLNQISHYACDPDPAMARATFDHLMKAPTWPTEWAAHMIFMAHADWIFTGDATWVSSRYESLKSKLLPERDGEDGLINSNPEQLPKDLVDWPPSERDAYEFTSLNTVINAFQFRALILMTDLANALGKMEEAERFETRATQMASAFHKAFFDFDLGIYRDGRDSRHASQHANLFALAFGLVPADCRPAVVDYLKTKGMACSVYAAQYLLEAFFSHGEADHALGLIAASGDRSWRHMVQSGTTITWEAWDQKYKPNQDWNHAWGAAPANLLSRFVLGVQPLKPGYREVLVRPQLGNLSWAKGKIPTVHGPIHVHAWRGKAGNLEVEVTAPDGVAIVS